MRYYDVVKFVTVLKMNMIDGMACGYGTLRTTAERIWYQISRRPVQRSQLLQIWISNKSNLGATENALAESACNLLSSTGAWEHLEVFKSSSEGNWSVWEVCVWLPNRFTFCWWEVTPGYIDFISYYHFPNKYTLYLSQLLISLGLSEISYIYPIVWLLKARY